MATNIIMNILNENGTYTELYPRTSAEQVSTGILSVDRIPNISVSKITEGILSVANGGTGVATSLITYGTNDLVVNSSSLPTGTIYVVYE